MNLKRPKCPDCKRLMWPSGGTINAPKGKHESFWSCDCGCKITDINHEDGTLKISTTDL